MKDVLFDTKAAKILRSLYSNLSYCGGCGIPWKHCQLKSVSTSNHNGTFATCTDCWNTLTLLEIRQCFKNTYESQEREGQGKYVMNHTLAHLLQCVEEEYNKTRK